MAGQNIELSPDGSGLGTILDADNPPDSVPNGSLESNYSNVLCHPLETPSLRGLFIQPLSGKPIVFGVRSGKDLESIRRHIWKGGGKVEDPGKDSDESGHRICLFDPTAFIRPKDKDIFDHQYILDCVKENVLKENILDYRINKKSMYEKYDPIEILLGVKTWNDIDKRISLLDQRGQEDECSDIGKF